MHNPRGRSDDKFFATSHEYALFYGRNAKYSQTYRLKLTEEQTNQFPFEDAISKYRLLPLKRTGSNSTPDKRPNLYYPLYFNISTKTITSKHKDGREWIAIQPLDSNGAKRVWRWGKTSFEERAITEIVIKEERESVLVKCCGNSFQHLFSLTPYPCQFSHLFSLQNSVFKLTSLQYQSHQIGAAIESSPVSA